MIYITGLLKAFIYLTPSIYMRLKIDVSDLVKEDNSESLIEIAHALCLYFEWRSPDGRLEMLSIGSSGNQPEIIIGFEKKRATLIQTEEGRYNLNLLNNFPSGTSYEEFLLFLRDYLSITEKEKRRIWAEF